MLNRGTVMSSNVLSRVAIVTGGARGIGRGIAERLSADGYDVSVWDYDLSPLRGGLASAFAHQVDVDVRDHAAVTRAFEETLSAFGQVDVLVNNAGVNGPCVPTWEYPIDEFERVIATNLAAVFFCCRAVLPHMRQRQQGRIITVASIAAKDGVVNVAPYCASKHGVLGLTKALAREVADCGILVNCVAPGMVETDLMKEMTQEHIRSTLAKFPLGRFCTVTDVANMVAWIAGPQCAFTTGVAFDLSGGRAQY